MFRFFPQCRRNKDKIKNRSQHLREIKKESENYEQHKEIVSKLKKSCVSRFLKIIQP
jgi:hypothetical protein